MGFSDAVSHVFRNYATMTGRASRREFWWFYLFTVLAYAATGLIDTVLHSRSIAAGLLGLGLLLPSLGVSVRRLHDSDRSGWWLLLCLVPVIGWVVLIIWYVLPGTAGRNRFGASPPAVAARTSIPA